ncbi:NADPH:quinone oxidoreductase family protein [Bradyrhizobium sp. WSM3983]|uniref:NADPH:quinone oxidoreductase family protein n=1 Tax=Bradyrhizobium sp. WSM3983 TaxID=1038867 RepID=UPI00040D6794|nr:NADPH:quinone oxidoreductase family protein [Bradyrhizobium sp. WSM3983]
MKAVLVEQFSPVQSLRIQDVPTSDLPRGRVRVRIKAAGIGFVDGLKVQGLYQTRDPLPFVPGMEFAGVVDEIGEAVSRVAAGDRVFGLVSRGALAEEIVVPENELFRIPENLSFVQSAAIPVNYLTATYGLQERAALRGGEILLVLGAAGGTGTAAIKVGKSLGAHVIAAASSEEKRSFACSQGADAAIDYTLENWRETLKSLTQGRAVNVVFDAVGGEISPVAFRTLAWKGQHLVVGFAAGKIPALPFNIALLKGASLTGVDSAQIRKFEPDVYDRLMQDVCVALERRSLEPPPTHTFSFANFQEAFETMSARRARGKIVVEVAD